MKRKLLVVLLALAMLITLTPTAAFAGIEDGGWTKTQLSSDDVMTLSNDEPADLINNDFFKVDEKGDLTWKIGNVNMCRIAIGGYSSSNDRTFVGDEVYSININNIIDEFYADGKIDLSDNYKLYVGAWDAEGNIVVDGSDRYYYTPQGGSVDPGETESGWNKEHDRYYYNDGSYAVNWTTIDDDLYYFGEDGKLRTGWIDIVNEYMDEWGNLNRDKNRYYADTETGIIQIGWREINGNRYYFHSDGSAAMGFVGIDGNVYYFSYEEEQSGFSETDGILLTGWIDLSFDWEDEDGTIQHEKNLAYADENGVIKTGWQKIDGKIYYFPGYYIYYGGTYSIGGVEYTFDDDGVLQIDKEPQFLFDEDGKLGWLLDTDIAIARITVSDGSDSYYYDFSGNDIYDINIKHLIDELLTENLIYWDDGYWVYVDAWDDRDRHIVENSEWYNYKAPCVIDKNGYLDWNTDFSFLIYEADIYIEDEEGNRPCCELYGVDINNSNVNSIITQFISNHDILFCNRYKLTLIAYDDNYDILGYSERLYYYHPAAGWDEGHTHYYFDDGTMAIGKTIIDGKMYHFTDAGELITGWILETTGFDDGSSIERYYYADNNGVVQTGWKSINGDWYYFKPINKEFEGGYMVTDTWIKDSKGWCYLGSDGCMVTNGWAKDSTGWCWIGSNGYMVEKTQWIKYNGSWYYIEKGYRVQNSWRKDSKGWCYLASDGKMVTNDWVKDSKGYCWIGSAGYMEETTKWFKIGSDWYHITKGYRDQSKWMKDSSGWCYLAADGKMVTNDWVKDSKGYCWIGSAGYMDETTKWFKIGPDWYHITKGYRDQSKWIKDSSGWCYLAADGKMVTNGFVKDNTGYCWIGPAGYMIEKDMWIDYNGGKCYIIKGYRTSSWQIIDNECYYFDPSTGMMYCGGTYVIDGVKYTFADDGALQGPRPEWLPGCSHVWDEGTVIKEATYEESGEIIYSCSLCGIKKTTEIPKLVRNGWYQEDDGYSYYYEDNVKITDSWVEDSYGRCYLDSDGHMVKNCWREDGNELCWIGSDGYMVVKNQWLQYEGGWYYIENGYMLRNKWKKDSKGWIYLGEDGKLVVNGWAQDSLGYCWMGPEGYVVEETKLVVFEGYTYGIKNGYMVVNDVLEIDGVQYLFGEDGKLIGAGG